MELLGLIFLVILLFICFGLLGWFLKFIGLIIELLFDGCLESFGCLVIIFFVLFFLAAMVS